MREYDTTPEPTIEGHGTGEDDVALSPYDSDLDASSTTAEPEHYRLDDVADQPTAVAPETTAQPAEVPEATLAVPTTTPEATAAMPAPDSASETDVAAQWAAAAAAPVTAAMTAPVADTAVRRASLMQVTNEPRPLASDGDARVDRYAPEPGAELFAGADYEKMPSRVGAHVWGMLATLLLAPVAWYLLSDAGARMTLPTNNQWDTGTLNLAAVAELLGGIVVLAVILLAARASALGAFIVGSLITVIGGAFVVIPRMTQQFLEPYLTNLRSYNDFGGNIAHHLVADGATGRILLAGIALILVGFVSHSARRRGRREQTIREAIERRTSTSI